jgi:COP9 signalosome complex subunit 1
VRMADKDKKKVETKSEKGTEKTTDKSKKEHSDKKSTDKKDTSKKSSSDSKKTDKKDIKKKEIPIVVPSANFDIKQYASRYEGHTLVTRLLFIAERYLEKQGDAYKLTVDALKKGKNTSTYRRLFEKIGNQLGSGYTFEQSWADQLDKAFMTEMEELEAALVNYKNNLLREQQRTCNNKIAELYFQSADFNGAFRTYMRTVENCTTKQHNLDLSQYVIRTSVQMGNFAHVPNYVSKAEDPSGGLLPLLRENPDLAAEFKVALALSYLENSRYTEVARKLSEVAFESAEKLNHMISVEDIAVYAALCGLAEFSRESLKGLYDDSNFQSYLEQAPNVKLMISSFYTSDYAKCLSVLETFKTDLQLDIHMHDHIGNLYEKIRNKALKEYFMPYGSVDLKKMADAFQTTVPLLEKEISKLILSGWINARIDSYNQRLVKREVPLRARTFQKTISSGEEFENNSRAALLRVNLIMNNMTVKPSKFEQRGMGGMGMGMGFPGMGGMGPMMGMPGMAGQGKRF